MGGFHFCKKNRNIALFEIKIVWNVRQPIVQTISTNSYLIMDVVCEYFLRFSIYDLGSCSLFNCFISCKNIKSLFPPLMIQFKIIAKIFLLYTFSNNHIHKWLITCKNCKNVKIIHTKMAGNHFDNVSLLNKMFLLLDELVSWNCLEFKITENPSIVMSFCLVLVEAS